jgi:hypothetical protein
MILFVLLVCLLLLFVFDTLFCDGDVLVVDVLFPALFFFCEVSFHFLVTAETTTTTITMRRLI